MCGHLLSGSTEPEPEPPPLRMSYSTPPKPPPLPRALEVTGYSHDSFGHENSESGTPGSPSKRGGPTLWTKNDEPETGGANGNRRRNGGGDTSVMKQVTAATAAATPVYTDQQRPMSFKTAQPGHSGQRGSGGGLWGALFCCGRPEAEEEAPSHQVLPNPEIPGRKARASPTCGEASVRGVHGACSPAPCFITSRPFWCVRSFGNVRVLFLAIARHPSQGDDGACVPLPFLVPHRHLLRNTHPCSRGKPPAGRSDDEDNPSLSPTKSGG